MRVRPLLRATSFRLALLQTLLFVVAFALTGVVTLVVVRRDEQQAVDAEIAAEVTDLRLVQSQGGLRALQATIAARQRDPSVWEFRVQGGDGRRVAGDLPAPGPAGWSTRRLVEGDLGDGQSEVVRALASPMPGGGWLTVGEDLGQRERADDALMTLVAALAAGAVALSLAVAGGLGRHALRRVEEMAAVMERYGAGDLAVRVRSTGGATDLDRLAAALNRMLQRTAGLMTGMRQISADIAHDLRRPLARHNELIARALQGPASAERYRAALEDASGQVEEVLQTFQALLHIAELEAGVPGLEPEPVDLAEVAARVVEAYRPVAEEGGRRLDLDLAPDAVRATIQGSPQVLRQMLANLVENALTHTPVGTRVRVGLDAGGRRLTVSDDGPGVPAQDLARIFDRFTRLDASRSMPGAGLGLALSAAVARAFHGRMYAEDAAPGLRVVADFTRGERVGAIEPVGFRQDRPKSPHPEPVEGRGVPPPVPRPRPSTSSG